MKETENIEALRLVQGLSASRNYPKISAGVSALAKALERASSDMHIPMADIAQKWSDASKLCPTPAELRIMAINLRDEIRRRRESSKESRWKETYGPAIPEWTNNLLRLATDASHPERMDAIRRQAITDALRYTEGDWAGTGDTQFWQEAAYRNEDRHPALVAEIRGELGL